MVLDKAQQFYYQSIILDLNRIKNNQPVIQISKEEICQSIDEINWKVNVEINSKLNESQQIGENIELMKFFEGVRNYQNKQNELQKQCI